MRGMKSLFHKDTGALPDDLAGLEDPFAITDRACCCPGRPVVKVLVPPTMDRPHTTELLLCGHHFRVSRAALEAAGVTANDLAGQVLLRSGHAEVASSV